MALCIVQGDLQQLEQLVAHRKRVYSCEEVACLYTVLGHTAGSLQRFHELLPVVHAAVDMVTAPLQMQQ